MTIRTNQKLLLAAAVVVMLNFTSCKKYEDGPAFSLRSKTARLTGEWEVVKIGGSPIAGSELNLEFEKDGDFNFSYSYGSYDYTAKGEWEWSDKKETIKATIDGETVEWEVLRLTNDEFWFEDDQQEEWKCEKK